MTFRGYEEAQIIRVPVLSETCAGQNSTGQAVTTHNTWQGAHLRRSSSPTHLVLPAGRHGSDDPADTSRQRGHGPSGDNLFPAKTLIDRNPSTPLPVPFAVAHRGPARSGEASPGLAATGTGQPRAPCRGTGEHQLSPANAGARLIPAGRGVGISGSRHGGGSACAGGGRHISGVVSQAVSSRGCVSVDTPVSLAPPRCRPRALHQVKGLSHRTRPLHFVLVPGSTCDSEKRNALVKAAPIAVAERFRP